MIKERGGEEAELHSAILTGSRELAELSELSEEPELRATAQADADELRSRVCYPKEVGKQGGPLGLQLESWSERLESLLTPLCPEDACTSVILEVSPGAGGDEAKLFASQIYVSAALP